MTLNVAAPRSVQRWAVENQNRFVADLGEFVRFASVSAQPKHAGDVRRCAGWLAGRLSRAGLPNVRVVPTARHPLVFARSHLRPGVPTVLIYGHYDVQPADPSAWRIAPPFAPVVRGENLHARGASDDKGPLLVHIMAIEAYLQSEGGLPVNVVCLFEGEEEIGSPHLAGFLARHRAPLKADVAVVSDTRMLGPDRPTLIYALRGGLGLEITVRGGARRDVHAGAFGGALHNPIQALCEMIAALHDREGRVTVPNFYNRVRPASACERAYLSRHGPTNADLLRDAKAVRGWGEKGYSLFERTTLRPALTVNGITGGYQGPGGKSVIPARASAKLGLRLVPDQCPCEIERLMRRHLSRLAPAAVQVSVTRYSAGPPVRIATSHPAVRAAQTACRRGFGAPAVFLPSGGSIPVVPLFRDLLGLPTVLLGFALPDDRAHAPDEKVHLPTLFRGMATCLHLWAQIASDFQQEYRAGARNPLRPPNETVTT